MIQLKEVLHYYLGCEVVDNFQGGKIATLTGVRLDWCYVRYKVFDFSRKVSQIQPILRSLEDMDDETAKRGDWDSAQHFKWFVKGHLYEGKETHKRWYANDMCFLLSEGFDLFNLIDTGQAIDKKTLNGEHQHPELLEKK